MVQKGSPVGTCVGDGVKVRAGERLTRAEAWAGGDNPRGCFSTQAELGNSDPWLTTDPGHCSSVSTGTGSRCERHHHVSTTRPAVEDPDAPWCGSTRWLVAERTVPRGTTRGHRSRCYSNWTRRGPDGHVRDRRDRELPRSCPISSREPRNPGELHLSRAADCKSLTRALTRNPLRSWPPSTPGADGDDRM
jgi:hypothetical protein